MGGSDRNQNSAFVLEGGSSLTSELRVVGFMGQRQRKWGVH
jgi:hypothetical protein